MMMKHAVTFGLLGLGLATLSGCPIYSDDRGSRVCADGNCYDCSDPYNLGSCMTWTCNSSMDCPSGYRCASDHQCHASSSSSADGGVSADAGASADGGWDADAGVTWCVQPYDCPTGNNCGFDYRCHAGDCSQSGCPAPYACALVNGSPQCTDIDSIPTPSCNSDDDCTAGSKCVNGDCIAPLDECEDDTQCADGTQCVQGTCTLSTPSCDENTPCPSGYACITATGECSSVLVCGDGGCQ
jgi:hypothetical protein